MADFLKIEDVLQDLELKEAMSGAEFGCGSADFAITLAKKLKRGTVFAIDIQEDKLSALKGKLALHKIHNVRTILADLESAKGSTLQDQSLDIVLIPNLLFQVVDERGIMNEAARVLKPGGQLVVIDWLKKTAFNKNERLADPEQVKKIAQSLGFSLQQEFTAGDFHYALFFTKK